jgi:transposase-like protein
LALGAYIEAFKVCRPVICIDDTFLTGKYKGTILTAVAADSNNQLLPLAIAFAEGENGDRWYWLIERLKNMMVQDVQDVCVIHNRHKGILQAINDMKEGSDERYRAPLWPYVKSRWCTRHMKANFHNQLKNKIMSKLFEQLCEQTQ